LGTWYSTYTMLSTTWGRAGILTILFFMVFYGVFLRFYPISTAPYWMDEGYTIIATQSYASGHTDGLAAILDSGKPYECIMYCYPTALITNHFGDTSTNYRILAGICGILAIGIVFAVTRLLYNWQIALVAAFYMDFAYYQVAWSTQARWYTMFLALFWLSILTLIFYLRTNPNQRLRRVIYMSLTLLGTFLTILTHKFGILLPVILLATTITHYVRHNSITLRTLLRPYVLGTVLVVLGIGAIFFGSTALTFLTRISLHYNVAYYASFLLRSYWGLLPFVIFALVTGTKRDWWLAAIFGIYLVPLCFLTNIVHYRYLFHVTPVLYILAAIGVYRIAAALSPKIPYRLPLTLGCAIALFYISGTGVLVPQSRYWLESDDPTTVGVRPSYAYTPQPDWNAVYAYVATNRTPDDIIISSQPQFTKIFLHEPGYWIYYDYLGLDDRTTYRTADNREYYVGATIVDNVTDLATLMTTHHGYIIYDHMAESGNRISEDILTHIDTTATEVFEKIDNSYSQIWVYRF